jgi:hypothetical protein
VTLEILVPCFADCKSPVAITERAVRDLGIEDAKLVRLEDLSRITGCAVMSTRTVDRRTWPPLLSRDRIWRRPLKPLVHVADTGYARAP